MSNDRIYSIPTADAQWQNDPDLPNYNPLPPQSVQIAVDGTDEAYLVGPQGFADWDALPSTLVGSWNQTTGLQEGQNYDTDGTTVIGTPTYPVTADYAGWIRPLGNEAGRATGLLDSPRWQGHVEQKFLQDDKRYPDSNAPFTLQITRVNNGADAPAWDTNTQYYTGDYVTNGGSTWQASQDNIGQVPFGGSPNWNFITSPGWGWSVVMLSADPLRDITARGIGVYSDPECTAFLYTTGAFVQDGSHDNNYYTECPSGQYTANPDQVNFALLFGGAQEGFFNLTEESAEALFWSSDQ